MYIAFVQIIQDFFLLSRICSSFANKQSSFLREQASSGWIFLYFFLFWNRSYFNYSVFVFLFRHHLIYLQMNGIVFVCVCYSAKGIHLAVKLSTLGYLSVFNVFSCALLTISNKVEKSYNNSQQARVGFICCCSISCCVCMKTIVHLFIVLHSFRLYEH